MTIAATGVMANSVDGNLRNTTFNANENITFDAYFNLGLIWVQAARVDFSVKSTRYAGKDAYRLMAAGSTTNTFAKFYTVHDTLFSYAEKSTLKPLFYKRIAHEDSYWAEDIFKFNSVTTSATKLTATCLRRAKEPDRKELNLDGYVTDLVTAIYRLRNVEFNRMPKGTVIPFAMTYDDDGKKFDLNIVYAGKETVTLKNGDRYRCIKLKPRVIKGKVFKSENAVSIWITDDDNRLPVYVEAKIRVGSLKGYVRNYSNLRHPVEAYLGKAKK